MAAVAVERLRRKPGAQAALDRLLSAGELPPAGWRVADELTWRTGLAGPEAPWAARARDLGSVTAWRSFQDTATQRWLWVQVIPLASAQDAHEAIAGLGDRLLSNQRAKVKLVREQQIEPDPVAGVSALWAREQHTTGPRGAGVARLLAGVADNSIAVVCASSSRSPLDWPVVQELLAAQAQKLG